MNDFIKSSLITIIIVTFIIGLPIGITLTIQYKVNPNIADGDFCVENGYSGVSITGAYQKYKNEEYGRVVCFVSYVEGNEYKKFDVKRDWRYKLHKVHNLENGDGI